MNYSEGFSKYSPSQSLSSLLSSEQEKEEEK